MRSYALFAVLAGSLVACATGVGAEDVIGADDAGPAHDSGILGKDASTGFDAQAQDVVQPQNDASTTKDSGNSNCAFSGTLATFDLTGEPGNQTSTAVKSTAKGVTAGALTRASTITATSGVNSINGSNWATSSSADATRYYTFSLTPPSGCSLAIDTLTISTHASGTGPTNAALATSDDAFAAKTTFTVGSAKPAVAVSGASGAVEVRVYGYGATSAGGTFRIDGTLTITGALS